MLRSSLLIAALLIGAAVGTGSLRPNDAEAAHHLAEISEVLVGHNGNPYIQYVEINQRSASGQQFTQGTILSWFEPGGSFSKLVLTVPGNVNPGMDRKWIMGTQAFEQASGMQVDFEFLPAGAPAGGMFCWGGLGLVVKEDPNQYVDCVAYGNYAGVVVPSPPKTGLPAGDCQQSLTRVVPTATFNAPNPPLGTWADGSNAVDFALAAPSPTNDIGVVGTLPITDTDGDLTIDCKDPDNDNDGINDPVDLCPLHVTATQTDADNDALGDDCEAAYGANPTIKDTDDDGCVDGRESRPDTYAVSGGGRRNPSSRWDFVDVPRPLSMADGTDGKKYMTPSSVRDKAIALTDVGVVLAYVGRTSTNTGAFYFNSDLNLDGYTDGEQLDRLPSTVGNEPWRGGGPGNLAITLQDVGIVLQSVGHACSGPP